MRKAKTYYGLRLLLSVLVFWGSGAITEVATASAVEIRAVVASNFYNPFREIVKEFQEKTGRQVQVISGSTGKLYAQIVHGAPFDLFLAADSKRPRLLEKNGMAVPGTRFAYAFGKIALWSPDPENISDDGVSTLREMRYSHLAIANPKTAPYGNAALQTLRKLNVWDQAQSRLVQGENIGQTFQFVASQNADLGFVALSQILDPKNLQKGKRWEVPSEYYDPLQQDAVILKTGGSNPGVKALWMFLQSEEARRIIKRYGYGLKE